MMIIKCKCKKEWNVKKGKIIIICICGNVIELEGGENAKHR